MDMALAQAKDALRAEMLARRARLTPAEVEQAGAAIVAQILASPRFLAAGTICGYMAIGNEAPTAPILRAALAAGKRVVLPRTLFARRELILHEVQDFAALHPGRYGILEPAADAPIVAPAAVELFLVPGAVFDACGNRLGYGAGLFDTLLAQSTGCRMALAYAWQVVPQVPSASHDIPMDLLVTESGVLNCRPSPSL